MNEIEIFDVIGQDYFGEGITAGSVKAQLDAMGEVDEIVVRLNSPGGDVFDGLAIFNLLKEHPAKITVKVDGYAASSASIIAMAGDEVVMGVGSQLMIHNPWTFALGESKDLRKTADTLDDIKGGLVDVYLTKTDSDAQTVSDWMDEELWLGVAEAKELGFATASSEEKASVHNLSGCRWIHKAPKVEESEPSADSRPAYLDYLAQSNRIAQDRHALEQTRQNLKA